MKDRIALELLRIAKAIVAKSAESLVDDLYDLWEDLNELNPRTFSTEEYRDFLQDMAKSIKGSKELKGWSPDLGGVVEGLTTAVKNGDDLENDLGVKASDLDADVRAIKKVFEKYDIYDRILRPGKYLNRERDFKQSNRAFLNVIPAWLKPIMIEQDLHIEEGIDGVYFQQGSEGGLDFDSISPHFEEVVDLIDWAKKNKAKMEKK